MEPDQSDDAQQAKVLQRGLIDEHGGRWFPLSLDTYFIEDSQVMRAAMDSIKRVLVRRGSPPDVDELPVAEANRRLLSAVPSPRELGSHGVRLYTVGGADLIAVLEGIR